VLVVALDHLGGRLGLRRGLPVDHVAVGRRVVAAEALVAAAALVEQLVVGDAVVVGVLVGDVHDRPAAALARLAQRRVIGLAVQEVAAPGLAAAVITVRERVQ